MSRKGKGTPMGGRGCSRLTCHTEAEVEALTARHRRNGHLVIVTRCPTCGGHRYRVAIEQAPPRKGPPR